MDKFSRRNVLGLAGAGLMAGAAHAAHAAEAPAGWDRECDVLVVGSGYAGLCAAIEARTAGADTLLIEKMVVLGGNSALCGGGIAAPGRPSASTIISPSFRSAAASGRRRSTRWRPT